MTAPPLTTWLDLLHTLMPPQAITLIGAGIGTSPWALWLAAQPTPATLVEADPSQFAALQHHHTATPPAGPRTLINTTVAPQAGPVDFHHASLPPESGLLPTNLLRPIWPNLHTLNTETVQATPLAQLTENTQAHQWLLIDCLPAASIISAAQDTLAQYDLVLARVLHTQKSDHPAHTSLDELRHALPGFELIGLQPSRHPDIAHALLARNYLQAWQQAADQNSALTKAKVNLEHKFEQAPNTHAEQIKLHQQQNQKLQEQQAKSKETENELNHRLQLMKEEMQRAETEANLQNELKKQTNDLIKVRKYLDKHITTEITNATRQIHAAAGLEQYWQTGQLPTVNTESHGWPISPDFALYLVFLLEQNNYDLILEFGSGISTVVIAKAIKQLESKRSNTKTITFASFDHLDQYHQQTMDMLKQAELDNRVLLQHAPLKDWEAPNGKIYPYYDCHQTLQNLAQQHPPKNQKILVVVDGPPGSTGPHARYPAGPLVLKHFQGADIDFLLDDYARQDEKEIADLWQSELNQAGLKYKTTQRKLHKDACLIQISGIHNN